MHANNSDNVSKILVKVTVFLEKSARRGSLLGQQCSKAGSPVHSLSG